MTTPRYGWGQSAAVAEWLEREPYRFEFLQAVRILEAILQKRKSTGQPESKIRFRSRVSFDFPASEVQKLSGALEDQQSHNPEITVNVLGLAGALGPLPQPYGAMVLSAMSRKDFAAADFLDIFNNRLVELFLLAHKSHKPELTASSPDRGLIAQYLYSLIGLGQTTLRNRLGMPDKGLLHYAGLLNPNVRSAAGLERLLADYFGIVIRVLQFRGIWHDIDTAQQTRIGVSGRNQMMGQGAVLGKRVWDQCGGVTLEIGPLPFERFQAMLPGQKACLALGKLAGFYLGVRYRIQVRLLLRMAEVPKLRMGSAVLGYSSWLHSGTFQGDRAATEFTVSSV